MQTVLILGSGPNVVQAKGWPRAAFDHILAINNAWRVRPDWDALITPWDFPPERLPAAAPGKSFITQEDFVPGQNALGGFVYAGGTMAFTAGYWALFTHRPKVIAMMGCDMHYPKAGATHFYGIGSADPLRPDITLRSLEAKSARLMLMAAMRGCAMVNLSAGPSRLVFPRCSVAGLAQARPLAFDTALVERAVALEASLGYFVASGRYWEQADQFDPQALAELDALWLAAARPVQARSA